MASAGMLDISCTFFQPFFFHTCLAFRHLWLLLLYTIPVTLTFAGLGSQGQHRIELVGFICVCTFQLIEQSVEVFQVEHPDTAFE